MHNKTMGCLECLADGFKTMCNANIFLRIIQFCVFFLTHIFFLRIIKFLLFYCFVRQEDYNISPDCGQHLFWPIRRKKNLIKIKLQIDIIFYFALQNLSHNIHYHYYFLQTCYKRYITLQDLSHNIHYHYYFLPTCYKPYITLQDLSHNIHYHYYFFPTCYKRYITLQDLPHTGLQSPSQRNDRY